MTIGIKKLDVAVSVNRVCKRYMIKDHNLRN